MRRFTRSAVVRRWLLLALWAAPGGWAQAAPVTQLGPSPAPAEPPAAVPSPPPAAPGPPSAAPPAPAAPATTSAPPAPAGVPAAPSPPSIPIPTADAAPAASDHDLVIGHWGIEARRLSPGPYTLVLRPGRGCPSTATTPCTVEMGLLGVRYWWNRNAAINIGAALAIGGGKEGARTLDSYAGGGPQLGLTVLLGNWRHLAVGASPQLGVFLFKPGGETASTTVIVQFAAMLEGELHFGFLGVPALSIGMATGLGFRYEKTPDASTWSIGVAGPESAWGVLTDLFLRYYL
jgi:hypothetical protein